MRLQVYGVGTVTAGNTQKGHNLLECIILYILHIMISHNISETYLFTTQGKIQYHIYRINDKHFVEQIYPGSSNIAVLLLTNYDIKRALSCP